MLDGEIPIGRKLFEEIDKPIESKIISENRDSLSLIQDQLHGIVGNNMVYSKAGNRNYNNNNNNNNTHTYDPIASRNNRQGRTASLRKDNSDSFWFLDLFSDDTSNIVRDGNRS